MHYVGIDWSYSRAAWCAKNAGDRIYGEGKVPADADGLAKLVAKLGPDVKACVEMMSGAAWVHDRLTQAGWDVDIADARKVKAVAPLAVKTDKVDARVLAELCRRDLVPAVWVRPKAEGDLNVPAVWLRSVKEAVELVGVIDSRLDVLDKELIHVARKDRRVKLLKTIPGLGDLLALAVAVEVGDIARFESPKKLVSYAGLCPKVKQSGKSQSIGPLSKKGSTLLRFAAVEAAQQSWRPLSPWHDLYNRVVAKTGKKNPAKAAVARKVLIASWHVLSRGEGFKACRSVDGKNASTSSSHVLAA